MRTYDMLAIANFIAHRLPNLFSLEMWGGATFDVALRFLKEDPWERLQVLREAIPNICFQMLLRASNAVGYTAYPDNVVQEFIYESAAQGIDIFRVFDSLNWLPNMKIPMEAVRKTGRICEGAICYTGDILDPKRDKYPLQYYVRMAKELERMGAHVLGIKDMAGCANRYAAEKLVRALRERDRPADPLPHARHERHQRGFDPESVRSRCRRRGRRDRFDERNHEPAESEFDCRCVEQYAARYRARSGSAERGGQLLGDCAHVLRSVRLRLRNRERRRSTCTRCRAGNTRTCASRPKRWASARAGRRSPRRMPT